MSHRAYIGTVRSYFFKQSLKELCFFPLQKSTGSRIRIRKTDPNKWNTVFVIVDPTTWIRRAALDALSQFLSRSATPQSPKLENLWSGLICCRKKNFWVQLMRSRNADQREPEARNMAHVTNVSRWLVCFVFALTARLLPQGYSSSNHHSTSQ
jgi:hypothetical protein